MQLPPNPPSKAEIIEGIRNLLLTEWGSQNFVNTKRLTGSPTGEVVISLEETAEGVYAANPELGEGSENLVLGSQSEELPETARQAAEWLLSPQAKQAFLSWIRMKYCIESGLVVETGIDAFPTREKFYAEMSEAERAGFERFLQDYTPTREDFARGIGSLYNTFITKNAGPGRHHPEEDAFRICQETMLRDIFTLFQLVLPDATDEEAKQATYSNGGWELIEEVLGAEYVDRFRQMDQL